MTLVQQEAFFPLLAVALLSIVATALLLASYYIFVVKLCRSSGSTHDHDHDHDYDYDDDESFIALSPEAWNRRGLDESAIRDIPSFQFTGGNNGGCVVCLSEFQLGDTLRALPGCNHAFHSDCVDVWLQSNPNCPLCRAAVVVVAAPPPLSSSPRDYYSDGGSDEDFVVIELGGAGEEEMVGLGPQQQQQQQQRSVLIGSVSPRKIEKRGGHRTHETLCGQAIRRSFSWDSTVDRQLYTAVREIMLQRNTTRGGLSDGRLKVFSYEM